MAIRIDATRIADATLTFFFFAKLFKIFDFIFREEKKRRKIILIDLAIVIIAHIVCGAH